MEPSRMQMPSIGNVTSEKVVDGAVKGAIGYLAVWAFTNLNPMGGFIFGAVYEGAGLVVDPIFNTKNSTAFSQLLGRSAKIGMASAAALGYIGVAFTVGLAVKLTITVLFIPVMFVMTALFLLTVLKAAAYVAEQRKSQSLVLNLH